MYDADYTNDAHADVADTLERVSWVYFAKMPAWTWMLGLTTWRPIPFGHAVPMDFPIVTFTTNTNL